MRQVVVIGSYNVGLTVVGSRIPRPGETVMGHSFDMGPGGKGSNQAIAVARLGGRVAFLARVGRDVFGQAALDLFRREGLALRHIAVDAGHATGAGIIFLDAHGQNAIGVAPGANYAMDRRDLDRGGRLFRRGAILLMQLETPLPIVREAIRRAKKAGMTVVLNPAPAPSNPLDSALLRNVDLLTPNETEAEALSGVRVHDAASAGKAARKLRAQGVREVVITLGGKGALWMSEDGATLMPAYKVKVVDTTGAGDAFNGGLVTALSADLPMPAALDFAAKVAAFSVTRLGVVPGLPRLRDIRETRWIKRIRVDSRD